MGFSISNLKKITLLIYCLSLPFQLYAADHSEDHLVVNGENHYIRANPLNKYLSQFCKYERLEKYVNNFCVPNWPDYTRYWEIIDGQLYIVKIENKKKEKYPFDSLFYQYDGTPVFANWFSGILSYRRGNSPKIQLNHVYYEKEIVVRVSNGIVTETFEINHRDRWILYSKRLVEKHYPLAPDSPYLNSDGSIPEGTMTDFLTDVLSAAATRTDEVSRYYPTIQVEVNANLDHFQLEDSHRPLSCYELMEVVAENTGTSLDITMSGSVVIYAINERGAPEKGK